MDLVKSTDYLGGEAWRPAVLPAGSPTQQHSVLQGFRDGFSNLLIARAGLPCTLDGITCDIIIRSATLLTGLD